MNNENAHLDVVRHLVEVGADKDQAQNQGATVLDLCQHQLPPNDGQHQDGRSQLQCTMVLHRYPWPYPCQHQLPPNDGQHQDGRSELQCTMVLHRHPWPYLCQHQLPPNDGQHQDGRSQLQ